MKLILFDGIKRVFNIDIRGPGDEFSGWTDKGIIFELLGEVGIDRKEVTKKIDEIYENIVDYIEKNIGRVKDFKLLPGVRELLEKLDKEGYILGLLTGNIEEKAKIKIGRFGIENYFKIGAFGGVTEIRSELVPIVMKQAGKKYETKLNKQDVFIVGDTPRDIKCGKDNGIKTIAVCTSVFTRKGLEKYHPDYVFDDLTNADEFLRVINTL